MIYKMRQKISIRTMVKMIHQSKKQMLKM